jgi:hypothetical protein
MNLHVVQSEVPVEPLMGLTRRISEALEKREIGIAYRAIDALVQNGARGTKITAAQRSELCGRALQDIKSIGMCERPHSAESIAALVSANIRNRISELVAA